MEEGLLQKLSAEKTSSAGGGRRWVVAWSGLTAELKKMGQVAGPMVAVTVSQYLLQVVSMSMVGHLDELSLSGVAVATSLANVTGFSLLIGMAGALETLCGQAFGAEQYQKLGSYTYCSIISLCAICIPISILWVFMDKLLILFGQDPEISAVACEYAVFLIPALFGFGILESLVRYYQSQSLISPMFWSTFSALCLHVPLCWVLVHKFGFGVTGAALSLGISYWFNAIVLWFHMNRSSKCEKSRVFIQKDALAKTKEFFSFAIPSAMMMCLEWWSFELMVLLSGLLPNSKLETSVLSICLTTSTLHYYVVYGIGAAASIRVSNELGAGNAREARSAVGAAIAVAATEAVVMSVTLFCFRNVWGYLYSNETEVANYFTEISPVLCLSIFMDSLLAVLSGVARGTGWQHLGAGVNVAAYYLVGIPVGAVLCFVLNLKGKGLWIGILSGSTLQTILLALITCLTNWNKLVIKPAMKARERTLEAA